MIRKVLNITLLMITMMNIYCMDFKKLALEKAKEVIDTTSASVTQPMLENLKAGLPYLDEAFFKSDDANRLLIKLLLFSKGDDIELYAKQCIDELLKKNIPIGLTFRDTKGNTALHLALLRKNKAVFDRILEKDDAKAFIATGNDAGEVPIVTTIRLGDVESFGILLEKCKIFQSCTDSKIYYQVAQFGNKNMFEKVLQEFSSTFDVKVKNSNEETLLHVAAYYGNIDVAQYLLTNGVDINAISKKGTALYYAADQGKYDMIALLAKNGADVSKSVGVGQTPLDNAIKKLEKSKENDHFIISIKYLIAADADIEKISYKDLADSVKDLLVSHNILTKKKSSLFSASLSLNKPGINNIKNEFKKFVEPPVFKATPADDEFKQKILLLRQKLTDLHNELSDLAQGLRGLKVAL